MYKFAGFTQNADTAVNLAITSAQELGHTYVGSEHLLFGLVKEGKGVAAKTLGVYGLNAELILERLMSLPSNDRITSLSPEDLTPRAKRLLDMARAAALGLGHKLTGTEHLLMSIILENESYAARLLLQMGIVPVSLLEDLGAAMGIDKATITRGKFKVYTGGSNKKKKSDGVLELYSDDLTRRAASGQLDPVIGREAELNRIMQILSRRTKNSPCLIGEPGVGKTAIVESLAMKISKGEVPEILKGKRLISLDLNGILAGTKYRGDFEERIKNILEEVRQEGNILIFIDEIHNIIGTGAAEGAVDAASIIKPRLARGELQVIGATTISEYRKNFEKDAALERRFQPLLIREPTEGEALQILKGLRGKYEVHHKVKISDEALESAVRLSARYISQRFLPDKAIDLMDETASRLGLHFLSEPDGIRGFRERVEEINSEKIAAVKAQDFERAAALRDEQKRLGERLKKERENWRENGLKLKGEICGEDIAKTVALWTSIPVYQLNQQEEERLLGLEETLHKRIVGQHEAVSVVAKTIRRGRVGLSDPNRPVGSFIFLGPTGVGKTELCKALTEALFGNEAALIRLDMSEYMEKHSVSKLVGSPPGYVGYEERGFLTEKVRLNPYSVLLFDEIEKAHHDVYNILLQVLEEGVLTDSHGTRVNFKNTVIIMTSNVGARLITERKNIGFGGNEAQNLDEKAIKNDVLAELKRFFRPEFLNRIDEIVFFNPLSRQEISEIAEMMLNKVSQRIVQKGIGLKFTKKAVEAVAGLGFDPLYGARPLRRVIQSKIEDELAYIILKRGIKSGEEVRCGYKEGEFIFEKSID